MNVPALITCPARPIQGGRRGLELPCDCLAGVRQVLVVNRDSKPPLSDVLLRSHS